MSDSIAKYILAINSGSSSLKVGVFLADEKITKLRSYIADGIGTRTGRVRVNGMADQAAVDEMELSDHESAIRALLDRIKIDPIVSGLAAIGHRVVHGGRHFSSPGYLIDDTVMAELEALILLAPEHMPQARTAIKLFRDSFPGIPQVACFDTAFHHTMTPLARRYPLPEIPETTDIIRYGFHGLSCESVIRQLQTLDPHGANENVVIAHLGNGASMTALRAGKSIDSTMGFSPTGGLMMGTRTGDLDPGALLYLMAHGFDRPDELADLVNKRSGLKGVSGLTSDMSDLVKRAPSSSRAADAIDLYCYLARKQLGALVTVLGGMQTLIFTGGIGENSPEIRSRICANLEFLGVTIDPVANAANAPVISTDTEVTVRVIRTDEERMIARHTLATIGEDHGVSV